MAAKRRTGIARFRDGPKRSRVRVGPWPFIFFTVAALVLGAYAIAVNRDAQDKINAYNVRASFPARHLPGEDK